MPIRNKREILFQNARYQSSIAAVEKEIKAISIDFEDNEENFSPVLFDQNLVEKLTEIQKIYSSLNQLKKDLEDLILEATYRPAKIKTGQVKKHIQEQINTINDLAKIVDTKLLEIINFYEDKSHLLFKQAPYQEQIANIIGSFEKIRDFLKDNRSSNTTLMEKLTHLLRTGKQSQVLSQQMNLHFAVIDTLDNELRQLQNSNALLLTKVSVLEERLRELSKQSDTTHSPTFFKTDSQNRGDQAGVQSSMEASKIPK